MGTMEGVQKTCKHKIGTIFGFDSSEVCGELYLGVHLTMSLRHSRVLVFQASYLCFVCNR